MEKTPTSDSKDSYKSPNIVGDSSAIKGVLQQILKVATSNSSVLIQGESGTGKGLIARLIHSKSCLANKPFIKVIAIGLSENNSCKELLKRMFSSDCGSDTLNGGTIYLDEIMEYPDDLQKSILQFLDENESKKDCADKYNYRIIASTNKNIEENIKNNSFRKELYYRISTFPLYVPPLRDRKEDIVLLANYFVERHAKEKGKHITQISTPVIEMLIGYHWPGNVRELENCIERAILVCDCDIIHVDDMPPSLQMGQKRRTDGLTLVEHVVNLEKELIINALKKTGGCQRRAAAELGITERILGYKINKYKIR